MDTITGEAAWAEFGREFYERYRRGGFARMPKREIDILVFHLLEQHAGLKLKSETELAQKLGSTPSRIKGLRTDARYLYWTDADREAEVRRAIFGAIANEAFQDLGDHIGIQITDAFARQVIVDVLERNHMIHDTSFNRAILKLDRTGLAVLMVELLSEEQKQVLAEDPRTRELFGERKLRQRIVEALKGNADDLGKAVRSTAVKEAAGWLLSAAKTAIPALIAGA